jgi:hypothetical protein
MLRKSLFISLVLLILVCLLSPVFGSPVWTVNEKGEILKDGQYYRVKGGSWFGLEGRYEIASDANNPRGAPMEMYMGNVWWQSSNRTYDQDATDFKNLGFNTIRLPVVHQTLDNNDPQGKDPVLKNTQSVRIQGGLNAIKQVMKSCNTAGLMVMLDIHSCSNWIGWRAGRFDAKPPYADANRDNYDYKREDCSCSASGNPSTVTRINAYNETLWKQDLTALAKMDTTAGTNCLFGVDIFNEPWDYTWTEWKRLIEVAYSTINAANPNILTVAQGIGGSTSDKTQIPHGNINPNWGENLYPARNDMPNVPKSKLVFSPHTYGPSVCTQGFFADTNAQPECADLQEDAFGDAKCQIVLDKTKLESGWEEHFGYLREMGYAIAIGEWGGNMDWPSKAEKRHQDRYKYLTNKQSDLQWQTMFKDYLKRKGILDNFYWSINPESSDTYGVYTTPYDPLGDTGSWGTWREPDTRKVNMLKELWNAPTPTISITTGPTATPTTTGNVKGDADGNGRVEIIDALAVARYAAGLPSSIVMANSDMNNDGRVDINDALAIARRVAGL